MNGKTSHLSGVEFRLGRDSADAVEIFLLELLNLLKFFSIFKRKCFHKNVKYYDDLLFFINVCVDKHAWTYCTRDPNSSYQRTSHDQLKFSYQTAAKFNQTICYFTLTASFILVMLIKSSNLSRYLHFS